MDLEERIARRRTDNGRGGPIVDRDALSPTVHREEPVGRGSVLEWLLDAVEPTFSGELPAPFAVVGPPGSGTSAVVTALFRALNADLADTGGTIGTTTRAGSGEPTTWFVYVDARRVGSAFSFYRTVLSTVDADPVPTSGVGTDDLRDRLRTQLSSRDRRAVVAIDHHDEPGALSADRAEELLEPVAASTTAVFVGQRAPAGWEYSSIEVPAYRRHELVDILTERASAGLAGGTFDHRTLRTVAEWADGNAHDALTALFVAAILACDADATSIDRTHLEAAMADIPRGGVHVDRVLSLSETRQRVIAGLIALESAAEEPIRKLAEAIAADTALTTGTVKRLLYELADDELLARVPLDRTGSGRRPSTLEPRFSTVAFTALSPVA